MIRQNRKKLIKIRQKESKILSYWYKYKSNKFKDDYLTKCGQVLMGLSNFCDDHKCYDLLSTTFDFLKPSHSWEENSHIKNLLENPEKNSFLLGVALQMSNKIKFKEKNNN